MCFVTDLYMQFVEEGKLQKQAEIGRLRVSCRSVLHCSVLPLPAAAVVLPPPTATAVLRCGLLLKPAVCLPLPPCVQAKYGDEAAKQIAARRQREAELAAGGEDANLIPLGVRVRKASSFLACWNCW